MKKVDRIRGIQWVGFSLLFAGAVAKWLHLDPTGIVLNSGLILFSLFFFTQGIGEKAYVGFGRHNLKLVAPVIIILFSVEGLISGTTNYAPMLVVVLAQYPLGKWESKPGASRS